MKKILVLVVSLIGMAVFFSGCAKEGGPIESKSYTSEGENITSVSIDVRDKEIAVTPSYDELVHINYYENDTRYYNISISDGLLVLTEKSDGGIGEFFGIKSSNQENVISLQIPKSLITTLEISTTNENILLSDITRGCGQKVGLLHIVTNDEIHKRTNSYRVTDAGFYWFPKKGYRNSWLSL